MPLAFTATYSRGMRRIGWQGPSWQSALCALGIVVLAGCQSPAKTAAAPPAKATPVASSTAVPDAPAPEPPRVGPRTGSIAPVVHETSRRLEVVGRALDGDFEIIELELPAYQSVVELPVGVYDLAAAWRASSVRLSNDADAFAFVGSAQDVEALNAAWLKKLAEAQRTQKRPNPMIPRPADPPARLWVRRRASKEMPAGLIFVDSLAGRPGHRIAFHVETMPPATARGDRGGAERLHNWAAAAATFFDSEPGAFYAFAAHRLRALYLGAKSVANKSQNTMFYSEFAQLMGTTSGRRSLQEALEHNRPLYLAARREKQTIPIEQVPAPQLGRHPWSEMSKALQRAPREEPLARATPAEFYFVRVKSFAKFLSLLDWLRDIGQPAADLLDSHSEDRGTLARYQDELGLEASGLSRALGPSVIEDVAMVGSDPYVHEGSDVTLIFRVKNAAAFQTGRAAAFMLRSRGHGDITVKTIEHEGVKIMSAVSADGRVRSHTASVNGLELVSNSPNAIRRVISTINAHRPALANEPDFRYLLARDAEVDGDAFAYVGDSFVAQVIGPAQKIAEARRQLTLAELSAPGYAALLAGWLDGKSPSSTQALVDAKWLDRAELRHAEGAPIAFEPGHSASSVHGTPAALTPLIDEAPVVRVGAEEKQAYTWFANGYSNLWSDRIDPIAVSFNLDERGHAHTLSAEMRVLPLLRREFRDWIELVGDARVSAPDSANGARIIAAIGKDARVRGLLDDFGRDFMGDQKLRFDWLGDYVILGASNRNELANAVLQTVRSDIERPDPNAEPDSRSLEAHMLLGLPVYAIVALKSPLAAGIALTALRQKASDAAPGAAEWGRAATYRGQDVVRVRAREMGESLSIFYALMPSAFVISLNEAALHEAMDQVLDAPPKTLQPKPGQAPRMGQVLFEAGGDKQSALYRIAAWFAEAELLSKQRAGAALADAVLHGAPETQTAPDRLRSLLQAYFGAVPLTPDGRNYEASPEGARDPVRGTPFAPTYPDVPVPGSPLQLLLAAIAHLKSEQSYDAEPGHTRDEPRQSLRVKAAITTRAAEKSPLLRLDPEASTASR